MRAMFWLAAVYLSFLLLPLTVHAAPFCVDDTSDGAPNAADCAATCDGTNDCSLRDAIQAANDTAGDDVITVSAGTYTLTEGNAAEDNNAEGDLDIRETVTITGAGASSTSIDGNENDRVFDVDPGSAGGITATISNVTIRGGKPAAGGGGIRNKGTLDLSDSVVTDNETDFRGGGIWNFDGTMTIDNCTINDNRAVAGGFAEGAGLATQGGTLTITNSTISGNTANENSQNVNTFGGGAFLESGTVTITNSTISGNTATGDNGVATIRGGGIALETGNATVTIINTTVFGNSTVGDDSSGGGIYVKDGATLNIKNTIIASNTADGLNENCEAPNDASIVSQENNLSSDTTCLNSLNKNGDQNSVGGMIVIPTLADNGGDTLTHTLPSGSPAIDGVAAGDCIDSDDAALVIDQRGFGRPADGDDDGTALCDVGAVEVGCGNGNVDSGEDCDDGNVENGDGCSRLCETESGEGVCGDGTVDDGEACDDGNTDDGDGCSNACTLETENDLEAANPNVDFDDLTQNQAVELTAPDPTSSSLVLAQTFPDDCTFAWTVTPDARGSFDDATTQTTNFTPGDAGTGQITVQVDCVSGGSTSSGTFSQSIVVNAASSGTGGGCSLIRH